MTGNQSVWQFQNMQMSTSSAFEGVLHGVRVADSCLSYSMMLFPLQTGQHCWNNDTIDIWQLNRICAGQETNAGHEHCRMTCLL